MDSENILSKVPFLKRRGKGRDGIASFDCPPERLREAVEALRRDFAFDALCDIASLDMGGDAKLRFGCAYHFYSNSRKVYARIVCMCKDSANPELDSLSAVFANADWFEREAFDMMGIRFSGHPDLRRILMWKDYPWHPMRKDFPLAGRPAPLPETYEDSVGDDPMEVVPAPMEGGPFHSEPGARFAPGREPRSRAEI